MTVNWSAGCLFPLFLVVATPALAAHTAWMEASYLGAYFVVFGGMMITVILLSAFARSVYEILAKDFYRIWNE